MIHRLTMKLLMWGESDKMREDNDGRSLQTAFPMEAAPHSMSAVSMEVTFVKFVWQLMEELLCPQRRIACNYDSKLRRLGPPRMGMRFGQSSPDIAQPQCLRLSTLPSMKWYGSSSDFTNV
jgi:hypothetical protein